MIPKRSINIAVVAPYIALLVMIIIASLSSEHFLQTRNLLSITRQVSYTGIIALGMTFVIIAGGIDLSVGSGVAFIGGVIILSQNYLLTEGGIESQWACFSLALGCGLILGTMGIYRSLALYVGNGGEFRVINDMKVFSAVGTGMVKVLPAIGSWRGLNVPIPSIIFILLAVVFGVIFNWTRFGRYVCAVGSNEKVAAYAAIRVARVRTMTYVICGLTVALSAFLLGGRMNSINSTNLYEPDSIAAVVIGGTAMTGGSGSMAGTVAGALMLGIISNMLNMWGVSAYLQGTVKGLVIILAVLVQRPEAQDLVRRAVRKVL